MGFGVQPPSVTKMLSVFWKMDILRCSKTSSRISRRKVDQECSSFVHAITRLRCFYTNCSILYRSYKWQDSLQVKHVIIRLLFSALQKVLAYLKHPPEITMRVNTITSQLADGDEEMKTKHYGYFLMQDMNLHIQLIIAVRQSRQKGR